ncbi:citrate lyase subunit alpha, partial [Leuconostoc mesenteroides]
MKNSVNREIPDEILQDKNYNAFETVEFGHPVIDRVAPKVRATTGDDKMIDSIDEVVSKTVRDGMTISFHHHFREGDFVFNMVMRSIIDHGVKDLTLAPSSLTNVMNDIVVEAIEKGVVTNISSSGMRGT